MNEDEIVYLYLSYKEINNGSRVFERKYKEREQLHVEISRRFR